MFKHKIFLLVLFIFSIKAMEIKSKKLIQEFYYKPEHLSMLLNQNIIKHAGCMLLIDLSRNEVPLPNRPTATSIRLISALKQAFFPIITSSSLLYNIMGHSLDTKLSLNTGTKSIPFSQDIWSLYIIPHSDFLLLIPQAYKKYYLFAGLDIRNLTDISEYLTFNQSDEKFLKLYNLLFKKMVDESLKIKSMAFLPKVFRRNSSVGSFIWDFIVMGHGTKDIIVNLAADQFNFMLDFFDKIKSGVVYILSCNAGGENLKLFEFKQTGIKTSHSYILINGAISDIPVGISPEIVKENTLSFFNNAAYLQDRGSSLEALMRSLVIIEPGRIGSIPQVWLPGGLGFQTLSIDKKIVIINNVFARTHEYEKKKIIINNKEVILLYPYSITSDIFIGPVIFLQNQLRKPCYFLRKVLPDTEDILSTNYFRDKIMTLANSFGMKEFISAFESSSKYYNSERFYLYPLIVSMIPESSIQYIKSIHVEGIFPNDGIFKFIRDAFFGGDRSLGTRTFLIDSLDGPNDIFIILNAIKLNSLQQNNSSAINRLQSMVIDKLTKDTIIAELLEKFNISKQGLEYVLPTSSNLIINRVIIEASRNSIALDFEINDTAWYLKYDKPEKVSTIKPWHFIQKDLKEHRNNYQNLLKKIPSHDPAAISSSFSQKLVIHETYTQKTNQLRSTINQHIKELTASGFMNAPKDTLELLQKNILEYRARTNLPKAYAPTLKKVNELLEQFL